MNDLIKFLVECQQGIVDTAKAEKRDLTAEEQKKFEECQRGIETAKAAMESKTEKKAEKDKGMEADAARSAERGRIVEISAMCKAFNMDSAKYIDSDMTVDAVRTAIMKELMVNGQPAKVSVTADEGDTRAPAYRHCPISKGCG